MLVAVARIFNNEEITFKDLEQKKKQLIEEYSSNQNFDKTTPKDDDDFTNDKDESDAFLEISEYMILDV